MLNEYVKYYYDILSDEEKKIYYALYQGLKERKKEIGISIDTKKYTIDDVYKVVRHVYNDTPSFYYLDMSHYTWREYFNHIGYDFIPSYIYSDKEIEEYERTLEGLLDAFKRKYIREGMTDYEKELCIHDYLVDTVVYDYEAHQKTHQAYNVIGALINRKAVCWGISCAFKLLCDYCDLKSFVILGDALPFKEGAGHAWNIVKLDKKPYHVDVTWDLKSKGGFPFYYEYLNLEDGLIKRNHTWDDDFYPQCTEHTYNYYFKNKLFVKTLDKVAPFVAKQLREGKKCITFKFAGALPPTQKILDEMVKGYRKVYPWGSVNYYYSVSGETHNVYFDISKRES